MPSRSRLFRNGDEGRRRERAAVVERDWAPLVRTTTPHTVGDGFYEVVLFLTPSGYAVSDGLYSANEHHRGVVSWRYDVTERHLPGPDALESGIFCVTPCLRTIGEIHALETRIQLLLETTGRELGGMHASWHVPGWVTAQAINGWNATPGELVWRNAPCLDMGGVGHCLAVIPASDGPGVTLPFVTIGVSPTSSATGRTRRVLPGHFWPELMPWRPGRALDRRLTEWAARQAPDRVRVQGDLALVWARWNDWLHERFVALRPLDTLDQVATFVAVPIMPQDDEA